MPTVTFLPDATTVTVDAGENLLRAAMLANASVSASCGGDGTCGKCRMVIEQGAVDTTLTAKLTAEEIERGYVLACLTKITGDVTVRRPFAAGLLGSPIRCCPPRTARSGCLGTSLRLRSPSGSCA